MERGFYNDDFEDLIKQKADQYKMYPSDQVWKGINRSLHTRRKWYWLSFFLFIGSISYYAIDQLIAPVTSNSKKQSTNKQQTPKLAATDNNNTGKTATVVPFYAQVTQQGPRHQGSTPPRSYVLNPDSREAAAGNNITPSVVTIPQMDPAAAIAGHDNEETGNTHNRHNRNNPDNTLLADRLALTTVPQASRPSLELTPLVISTEEPTPASLEAAPPTAADTKAAGLDEHAAEDEARINWLQEFAVYNLQVPKTKRLSWQLSFAPTMNYRKLKGNYTYMESDIKNVPMSQNVAGDPNELVNHKPALGFELGSHFLYAVNKNLQVRAGAQFNYSRYAIQAYGSYAPDVATIALNTTNPAGHGSDSVTNLTRLRNFGGDKSEDLQNQYFQLSLPVGLELRLLGAGKIQIGISGTIQPTYLINRQTYLITTDYKNYTKEPSLVRRWNVNTGAEIFLAYKSGDLRWQVGPQFRYQLFSSYVKQYPIREYLMEYGIKIGVTKTIR